MGVFGSNKIDRELSKEMREAFKNEEPLMYFESAGLRTEISVLQKGVLLNTWYFIPFDSNEVNRGMCIQNGMC